MLLRTEAGVATDHKPQHQAPTMFQKLGGAAAIQGVVDEFYTRVFADDDVKGFFEGINKQKLKAHQVDIPTQASLPPWRLVSASHNLRPNMQAAILLGCKRPPKSDDGKLSYESASLAVSCLRMLAAPITSDMSIVSSNHSVIIQDPCL